MSTVGATAYAGAHPAHAAVTFADAPDLAASDPLSVAVGDFNGDVKADLVATKVDQTKGAQVAFVVVDGDGNKASCY